MAKMELVPQTCCKRKLKTSIHPMQFKSKNHKEKKATTLVSLTKFVYEGQIKTLVLLL